MITAVTVLLALVTLGIGLKAASLWWDASRTEEQPEPLASMEDAPELWILGAQVEIYAMKAAAELNRKAAKWTAWAAIAGAMTSIWSAVGPMVLYYLINQ